MYSTPWGGDFPIIKKGSALLERIFFIEQGSRLSISPMDPAAALPLALVCQILPFGDKAMLAWAIDFMYSLMMRKNPSRLILPNDPKIAWRLKSLLK